MEHKVAHYIRIHRLLTREAPVVVGLSGGADSVALLRLLLQLGYVCHVAHCNFHLRGDESDRDESFVRTFCRNQNVVLHVRHFDTAAWAEQQHVSIEMAARTLRYTWFEELRQEIGAQAIAVAHHQDDSVETLLLNLLRGTGIDGLRGMRPRNGYVVRPLLCTSRHELLHYLAQCGQSYVTDSTNLQDTYTRNKIRLKLLPLMEEINPAVRQTLLRTAARMDEIAAYYQEGLKAARQRVLTPRGIDIEALRREPAPRTLLHTLLAPLGFREAQLDDVLHALDGQPGRCFFSATHCLVRDRKLLLIEKRENPLPPRLVMKEVAWTPQFVIPREKKNACLDADKLHEALHVRLWQQGDWFVPFGMRGRKRVSDYLTDRKISMADKARQWVLCCGKEIVWLVGERPDNRFCVDNHTKRVLLVSVDETK